MHLNIHFKMLKSGLPWREHKCETNTHTHTHAHFGSADNGLRWQRVMTDSDTLQTPSLLYPWEQHRRLCTCSTISDYPSQTNLTVYCSPAPSLNSALCLDPKPVPNAQEKTTIQCRVLPDYLLAPGPRSDPSVFIRMSFHLTMSWIVSPTAAMQKILNKVARLDVMVTLLFIS